MNPREITLSSENRRFFRLVERAAFDNPFTLEREQAIQELTGFTDLFGDKLKDASIPVVQEKIAQLESLGLTNFQQYSGTDRRLVRIALLYDAFHRFHIKFDRLIQDQIEAGDDPITVPFADEVLSLLNKRGFTHEESVRYLAFFYQLRRAFFFIGKTL